MNFLCFMSKRVINHNPSVLPLPSSKEKRLWKWIQERHSPSCRRLRTRSHGQTGPYSKVVRNCTLTLGKQYLYWVVLMSVWLTNPRLPLLVVKGDGPSLFGRNWLHQIRLEWHDIYNLHTSSLQAILQKHTAVFQEGLGTLKGFKAKILVEEGATPRFCKARTVPYSVKETVDKELDRLVAEGTLEPVQFSDWASPIVPVLKADKSSVRICGDFKQTINPVSKLDRYPIPKIEDLFASLAGGQSFTKIDLSQAYQQLLLDDESKQYVVINTHRGLFRYTRLPFGVSSAPGIFQRVMESILQGIPGVVVYIDDILVTGPTAIKHLETLEQVLTRLENAGLRAKQSKCKFMASSVEYLGFKIDACGLHPLAEKWKL